MTGMPSTGAVQVVSPDGQRWTVRRRWAPRLHGRGLRSRLDNRPGRRRRAERQARPDQEKDHWWEYIDVPFDLDGLVILLVLAAAVFLFVVFGIPLLLALLDSLLFLVLLIGGLISRVLFRRPWTVEAAGDQGGEHHWQVVGWRNAGHRRDELAERLRLGLPSDQV